MHRLHHQGAKGGVWMSAAGAGGAFAPVRAVAVAVRGFAFAAAAPLPLFDACFVLNLDRRPDRWRHVQQQLAKAKLYQFVNGLKVERVSGVDGQTIDFDALVRSGVIAAAAAERYRLPAEQKLFGMDLTPGAIGCALGHRKIWEMVVQRGLQRALILEDDVEFAPGLAKTLRQRLSVVPDDMDILYFGGLDLLAGGKPPRPFLAEGLRYAYTGHRELTAYVITAAAAAKCLAMSVPMTWQIDTHITAQTTHDPAADDAFISNPKSYVLQPSLAIQITTLGTDVQKKTADNPALEDASRRLREFIGGGTSVR